VVTMTFAVGHLAPTCHGNSVTRSVAYLRACGGAGAWLGRKRSPETPPDALRDLSPLPTRAACANPLRTARP
jgi:hypothetical protein